jgi:hypothetical protein
MLTNGEILIFAGIFVFIALCVVVWASTRNDDKWIQDYNRHINLEKELEDIEKEVEKELAEYNETVNRR